MFALTGGGFMTFMGGEDGIEGELRRAHALAGELAGTAVDHVSAVASSGDVLVVVRGTAVVCVNLSAAAVDCELDAPVLSGVGLRDRWSGEPVAPARDGPVRLSFGPWQPRVLWPTGSSA